MDAGYVLEPCWEIPAVAAAPFDFDRRVPSPSSRHPSTRLSTPSPARRPAGSPVVARRRTSWELGRAGLCGAAETGAGLAVALGGKPPEATEVCIAVEH